MDQNTTRQLAKEVIKRARHMDKPADVDTYINQYFARTWDHFDVNKDGKLDTLDMTAFMKYLASDQGVDLDELMK